MKRFLAVKDNLVPGAGKISYNLKYNFGFMKNRLFLSMGGFSIFVGMK